jgi:hypothetical protein
MSRRTARPIFFVCAAVSEEGVLVTKLIESTSPGEASQKFEETNSIKPQEVLGPFYKKRTQIIESTRVLKFSNETKPAIYNDWVVNAFMLKEPENHAYLVFIRRADGKKQPLPKGTITVPVSELRFLNGE